MLTQLVNLHTCTSYIVVKDINRTIRLLMARVEGMAAFLETVHNEVKAKTAAVVVQVDCVGVVVYRCVLVC